MKIFRSKGYACEKQFCNDDLPCRPYPSTTNLAESRRVSLADGSTLFTHPCTNGLAFHAQLCGTYQQLTKKVDRAVFLCQSYLISRNYWACHHKNACIMYLRPSNRGKPCNLHRLCLLLQVLYS